MIIHRLRDSDIHDLADCVSRFQTANGIEATGIADPATQAALFAEGALREDGTPLPEEASAGENGSSTQAGGTSSASSAAESSSEASAGAESSSESSATA